jgi:protein-S-isoprenylcysteine O-methyltransferase Ste14
MDLDQTFRPILVGGALVVFPITIYHRLRSQATGERLDRWQEGPFILFTLRPIGIAALLGLFAYMINPSWMRWSSMPLPAAVRWAGVGLGAIAGGLLVWTLRSLGTNLTDTVVTRRAHTLVTTGPYRWIRHPFYVAAALALLANSLAAANWFIFLTGGVAVVLMIVRTRIEEQKLLERFGAPYQAYRDRTGRFLPRI